MIDEQLISEEDKNSLDDIAYKAVQIKKALSLGTTALTPLNYNEEREKFFTSSTYNPHFIYQTGDHRLFRDELNELLSQTDLLTLPSDFKFYLQDYLINLHILNITLRSVGTSTFAQAAHALFDWNIIDADSLMKLFSDYPFNDQQKPKLYNAEMIKEEFEHVLFDTYGISDFNIHIDTFCHNIIRAGYKKVTIGSGIRRSKGNVDRLIVHEIESHVLQTYNMKQTKNPLLELSKYNDAILYSEGLAVYNEVMTQTLTRSSLETYYFRLKAVSMLHKSFREIYTYLAKSLPSDKAYLITYRVKRGMGDTALPGGFPKDAGYMQGFKKVHEYMKKGGSLQEMYYTKTPELTSLLRSYNLLPEKLCLVPRFLEQELTNTKSQISLN